MSGLFSQNRKSASSMATPREFELACPACDGPGIYAVEDGLRLRVGLTSDLSRFVQRQRTPVRILYVARLEPGKAPRAWKALLSSLRAQGLTPRECQFEASAAHDVARSMARAARHRSVLAASDIHRRAQRFRSPVRGESVASTQLESWDRGQRPKQSQEHLPHTFRRLLNELGTDD